MDQFPKTLAPPTWKFVMVKDITWGYFICIFEVTTVLVTFFIACQLNFFNNAFKTFGESNQLTQSKMRECY